MLPYLLIVAGGYSPLHAGMALLPLPVVHRRWRRA